MEGWIKLHRQIMKWKFFKNSEMYHLFTTLVMMANHKEGFTKDGTRILRGQLMTSRNSLSEITGINESKIFRILKKLKTEQQIELHSSRKNSIITLINYNEYQLTEQDIEQLVNNQRTAGEQQVNTNKNDNNNNNENNIIIKASPLSFLFDARPDIQDWLNKGNHDTHQLIVSEKSHHELVDLIEKAFDWAQGKNQRAESWLLTFVNNKKTTAFNPNQAKTPVSEITPDNLTGNPFKAKLAKIRAEGKLA